MKIILSLLMLFCTVSCCPSLQNDDSKIEDTPKSLSEFVLIKKTDSIDSLGSFDDLEHETFVLDPTFADNSKKYVQSVAVIEELNSNSLESTKNEKIVLVEVALATNQIPRNETPEEVIGCFKPIEEVLSAFFWHVQQYFSDDHQKND